MERLRLLVLGVLALLVGCHRQPARPNILLYVVDTLRADALGCYGNRGTQTPTIDRLALEGARFSRAYANASWTRASMGSLLTGVYPSTHGAVGRSDGLRTGIPTLQNQLKKLGYRTGAIVANPNIGAAFGFADGFDDFIELYKPHPGRNLVSPDELVAAADRVVDAALTWLKAARSPFFLLVFSVDPHAPYTPPAPYNTRYDPSYTGAVDGSLASLVKLSSVPGTPAANDIRHLRALYHGEVSFNDSQLARLVAELDRQKLADSTLLVITSDHGEEFYEHGGRDHGHTLYEELIHVPLIMRWTGKTTPGTILPGVVQLVDLFPTLMAVASGAAPVFDGPGRNLGPFVFGRELDPGPFLAYAEEALDGRQLQAIVVDYRKLIYDSANPLPQSFDLLRDPGERVPHQGMPPQDLALAIGAIQVQDHPPSGSAPRPVPQAELSDSAREALQALGYGQSGKTP